VARLKTMLKKLTQIGEALVRLSFYEPLGEQRHQ